MQKAAAICTTALGVLVLSGCPDSASLNDTFSIATAISLEPLLFLGTVPCSNEPGAMRSYVATIKDLGSLEAPTQPPFVLPSSPPVPCSQQVSFRYVVPGHRYSAEIDGYEQLANELMPYGGQASGSRSMLDEQGQPVQPRWVTQCADDTSRQGANVILGECAPLEDQAALGVTAIQIDPKATLGGLQCVNENGVGDVTSFDVKPIGGSLPSVLGIGCTTEQPVVYNVGIVPKQVYSFRVEATSDGAGGTGGAGGAMSAASNPYGASCSVVAKEGLLATASCTLLSSKGTLSIPINSILQDLKQANPNLACASYVASITDPPTPILKTPTLTCVEQAYFAPLSPGSYVASVEVRNASDAIIAISICTGDVSAGATTVPSCVLASP